MTAAAQAGALSRVELNRPAIDWQAAHRVVRRLQARIVKATREKRWGKVRALQHLLTHSFSGKAVAVKQVTENSGKRTPGVDRVVWNTPAKKEAAVQALKQRGYQPLPLRRVYIPKSNGKMTTWQSSTSSFRIQTAQSTRRTRRRATDPGCSPAYPRYCGPTILRPACSSSISTPRRWRVSSSFVESTRMNVGSVLAHTAMKLMVGVRSSSIWDPYSKAGSRFLTRTTTPRNAPPSRLRTSSTSVDRTRGTGGPSPRSPVV
jgi:N-terminal domain of reverse transcriptase